MYTVTTATLNDVETIRTLAEATWWPAYTPILPAEQIRYMLDVLYSAEVITTLISTGEQVFLLLSEGDKAVAFAGYSKYDSLPGAFKLHKLYCLPVTQGKGYGRILINLVSRVALQNGGTKLLLNVNRHNNALNFYKKMGFSISREEDIAIGPFFMNDYVMEKPLLP